MSSIEARNPDERYQKAGEILAVLKSLRDKLNSETLAERASSKTTQPSIAVLPFANLSADKEQEYFCDGMAEEIINALSNKDPEAYNSYLRGRYYWNKRTDVGFRKGIEHFQEAVEKDPTYALAYAGIADCYNLLGWYCFLHPKEAFPRAKAAAEKALAFYLSFQYDDAIEQCLKTIEMDPDFFVAHFFLGMAYAQNAQPEEAVAEFQTTITLLGTSSLALGALGHAYAVWGKKDEVHRPSEEDRPGRMIGKVISYRVQASDCR